MTWDAWREIIDKHIDDCLTDRQPSCGFVKLAFERHINDLSRQFDENFPYYFDPDEALRFLTFMSEIRHTKGEKGNQKFNITPNQATRYAILFGWRQKSDDTRRFRRVYQEMARKNGKSEEAAVVQLYAFVAEGEEGAEVYSAATKKEQARIVFDAAKKMARAAKSDSPYIDKLITIRQHHLTIDRFGSKMVALSSDDDTLDGLNPSMATVDEYHAHPNDKLVGVIETGMGARRQPLLNIITTAGFNIGGPCYEFRRYVIDVLEKRKEDDALFCIIYTLDESDDWQDESVWVKANPNLGITPSMSWMRGECLKAINQGGEKQVQFLTKNLNVWTSSQSTWIPQNVFVACEADFLIESLKGRRCFGGLDLANTKDINAFSLVFPPESEGEKVKILRWKWLPEVSAKEFEETGFGQYKQWADKGVVELTPGNVVDHAIITAKIVELSSIYEIDSIAYDPYGAIQLAVNLTDAGLNMVVHNQYMRIMAPPTADYERLIVGNMVEWIPDPAQAWMMSNVTLNKGPDGGYKPDKKRSKNKIDGIIADIIAISQMNTVMNNPGAQSYLFEDGSELMMI